MSSEISSSHTLIIKECVLDSGKLQTLLFIGASLDSIRSIHSLQDSLDYCMGTYPQSPLDRISNRSASGISVAAGDHTRALHGRICPRQEEGAAPKSTQHRLIAYIPPGDWKKKAGEILQIRRP